MDVISVTGWDAWLTKTDELRNDPTVWRFETVIICRETERFDLWIVRYER